MKGDKGNCQIVKDGIMVVKTKFDTQKNCDDRIITLLSLGATKLDTKSYKCKECNFWHLGNTEEILKYGK